MIQGKGLHGERRLSECRGCHAAKLTERSFYETLLAKEKELKCTESPEKVHLTSEGKRKTTSYNSGKRC